MYDEFDDEETPEYTFSQTSYLKGLHTRQLLNLRDKIYRVKFDDRRWHSTLHAYDVSSTTLVRQWVSVIALKAELATREHIPNKQEAKAIRRAKAQGRA